jgi:hypothetical protein
MPTVLSKFETLVATVLFPAVLVLQGIFGGNAEAAEPVTASNENGEPGQTPPQSPNPNQPPVANPPATSRPIPAVASTTVGVTVGAASTEMGELATGTALPVRAATAVVSGDNEGPLGSTEIVPNPPPVVNPPTTPRPIPSAAPTTVGVVVATETDEPATNPLNLCVSSTAGDDAVVSGCDDTIVLNEMTRILPPVATPSMTPRPIPSIAPTIVGVAASGELATTLQPFLLELLPLTNTLLLDDRELPHLAMLDLETTTDADTTASNHSTDTRSSELLELLDLEATTDADTTASNSTDTRSSQHLELLDLEAPTDADTIPSNSTDTRSSQLLELLDLGATTNADTTASNHSTDTRSSELLELLDLEATTDADTTASNHSTVTRSTETTSELVIAEETTNTESLDAATVATVTTVATATVATTATIDAEHNASNRTPSQSAQNVSSPVITCRPQAPTSVLATRDLSPLLASPSVPFPSFGTETDPDASIELANSDALALTSSSLQAVPDSSLLPTSPSLPLLASCVSSPLLTPPSVSLQSSGIEADPEASLVLANPDALAAATDSSPSPPLLA